MLKQERHQIILDELIPMAKEGLGQLDLDDQEIKFYIDDIENIVYSFSRPSSPNENNWPFSNSFYFVLDTSVGGEFSDGKGVEDSVLPSTFEIDYVRVYHAQ